MPVGAVDREKLGLRRTPVVGVPEGGAALVVAGDAQTLAEGVGRAQDAVDSGAGRATLARLVHVSQSCAFGQESR